MSMLSRKPIVIFDEPTSGLCKRQMDILIVFLNKMTEQGKIIIIITHDYEFLCAACDAVLPLHDGRVSPPIPLTPETLGHIKRLLGFS